MKINKLFRSVLCVAAISSAPAFANPFIAVDIGRVDASLQNFDNHETSYELSAGYLFNDAFALSIGYTDYGKVDLTKETGKFAAEPVAIDLTATGILALSDQFGLTGKVGIDFWESDNCVIEDVLGIEDSTSCDGEDMYVGIGMYTSFSKRVGMQFDYELHRWDDFEMNVVSLGVTVVLGGIED